MGCFASIKHVCLHAASVAAEAPLIIIKAATVITIIIFDDYYYVLLLLLLAPPASGGAASPKIRIERGGWPRIAARTGAVDRPRRGTPESDDSSKNHDRRHNDDDNATMTMTMRQ